MDVTTRFLLEQALSDDPKEFKSHIDGLQQIFNYQKRLINQLKDKIEQLEDEYYKVDMTDFTTWLLDYGYDRIFRMLEFRRPGDWTPYELENKWEDQSRYIDNVYKFIKIVEAIELPDRDILLGINFINPDENPEADYVGKDWIYYKRLSQIELLYMPNDMIRKDDKENEYCD